MKGVPQPLDADRPSQHGALLGEFLAKLADLGAEQLSDVPERCATCAFRLGSLANISAGTGRVAFDCAVGMDPSPFGCHHGLDEDGVPTKVCVGYVAATAVSYDAVRKALLGLTAKLESLPTDDPVRAEYDAWRAETDPEAKLDVYQLGRAWAKREATK